MTQENLHSKERLHQAPDVLIILGKNIGIGSEAKDIQNDNFHLSPESRINALAAGMLYKPGMILLFSSGPTAGGDTPSEAKAMKDYLMLHLPDIPTASMLLEENSIDTASNAEEVTKIIYERNFKHLGLVTVGYHLQNAATIFERYGTPIEQTFVAEDIVRERSPHHEAYIERWKNSKRIRTEKKKETLRKILLYVDPEGKRLQKITKRQRK